MQSIKPVGSRPGILYSLGKIHKETRNGLPTFCPSFSAIGTSTYKLAKFLLKFLTPLTATKYTVIDTFHFHIQFNRIPTYTLTVRTLILYLQIFPYLYKTIDICVDNLYNGNENSLNIPKHDFCNLLKIATK